MLENAVRICEAKFGLAASDGEGDHIEALRDSRGCQAAAYRPPEN